MNILVNLLLWNQKKNFLFAMKIHIPLKPIYAPPSTDGIATKEPNKYIKREMILMVHEVKCIAEET